MASAALRIHAFLPRSRANGPGERAVLWVQGCTLGCPGCFNPQTHPVNSGARIPVPALFDQIAALQVAIEGLTISGGEPFQQPAPLLKLLQRLRQETRLSILIFTGFAWSEVQRLPHADALLDCIDVLIAGRYDHSQRQAYGLLGSANKTTHFLTSRYQAQDLTTIPEAEITITSNGDILLSGIQPVQWR